MNFQLRTDISLDYYIHQSAELSIHHKMKNCLHGIYGDKIIQNPLCGTPPRTPTQKQRTSPNMYSPLSKSPRMDKNMDTEETDVRFGRLHG